jgi:hypothetical protein
MTPQIVHVEGIEKENFAIVKLDYITIHHFLNVNHVKHPAIIVILINALPV